jgi:hypothetical protein
MPDILPSVSDVTSRLSLPTVNNVRNMISSLSLWELGDTGNIKSGLMFPLTPEKINLKTGAKFLTYDILSIGTVQIPYGNELDEISWEGILPGPARRNMSIITVWIHPKALDILLQRWKQKGTKLRFVIPNTLISLDVYIQSYEPVYGGGFGDIQYSLSLVQAIDLKITTTEEQKKESRPQTPATTYTVKKGDTLWAISEKHLGNGGRYPEIFAKNKQPSGPLKNPNKIYPGQILKLS